MTPLLRELGGDPIFGVFDADRFRDVMAEVGPSVVVHQLTELPPGLDPNKMTERR
jgi:hypothetical protein